LELPEEQKEFRNDVDISEEDAAEIDRRNAAIRKAAEEAEWKRKTQVVQKSLPLISVSNLSLLAKAIPIKDSIIKKSIVEEMALLIMNDRSPNKSTKVEQLDDELIKSAKEEINKEVPEKTPLHDLETEVEYNPALFPVLNDSIEKLAERAMEMEKRLLLHHGGYQKRSKALRQKIIEAGEALEATKTQIETSETAKIAEDFAIATRLGKLREEVMVINKRERQAQEYYRAQKDELDSLKLVPNGIH
jgi:pre-mRNA-splicing factor CDC5/CEF1